MRQHELFVFILCLFIFIALTAFFIFFIIHNFSLRKKIILNGLDDEKIIKEYEKTKEKKDKAGIVIGFAINIIFVALFVALFSASLVINISSEYGNNNFTTVRVVESNSMSKKEPTNSYLKENNLDNQFQMFDLIVTHKLPKEEDLKLYDVVVYDQDGLNIIHRIVKIEEPNEEHPDCRHFTLRGDANVYNDREPVLYKQMKAIYRNERVQFIGSFILFFKAPAGYLCILLIVFTCLAIPFIDYKTEKIIETRLIEIGVIKQQEIKEKKDEKID